MPAEMEDNAAEVSDPMSDNEDDSETLARDDDKMTDPNAPGNGEVKKKYDPKDPLRPRRKKARRACYACQRAHLTCGDERPCKRCIKRGLAEQCQDGVRKKAKYLHDAPPEALGPVLGPGYNANANNAARANGHRHNSTASDTTLSTATPSGSLFPQNNAAPNFAMYGSNNQPSVGIPDNIQFNPQASPVSPSFQGPPSGGPQMGGMLPDNQMGFNALFDPSNPALYNFDLEGLNFGSQYAGWEFGILNKMGLGAETPPKEGSMSQTPTAEHGYATIFGNNPPGGYDSGVMGGNFVGGDQGPDMYSQGNLQHGLPQAYAIAAGPNQPSPSTEATASPQPVTGMDGSPKPGGLLGMPPSMSTASRPRPKPGRVAPNILGKRQRDSASIYESVKEPYPYTAGFHNLIAVLRTRLPLAKVLKVARALGEIRPSFISCTKDLTREDLIFMEKCFQRTLVEFHDFLMHCCAPTLVCRRTGEIAAVNREFTALTGWTKEVLLGKEPNRNVLRPTNNGDGERSETATPRTRAAVLDNTSGRPQPVFLAELMDDDSVVEFYRDYAQLAFEDSRGKVQRRCGLLKYRTQQQDAKTSSPREHQTGKLSNRVSRIDGDNGISVLERDGKVECTYCWTIKRDVFDIPMMIIINFLPRYHHAEHARQLAV